MRIAASMVLALLTAACAAEPGGPAGDSGAPTPPTDATNGSLPDRSALVTPSLTPGRGPSATRPTVTATGVDPALQPLVDQARSDLAQRRSVATGALRVMRAVTVTWPDASLGCPAPGRSYAQVPVDGALIELSLDGVVYPYHSGSDTPPTLCTH